MGFDQQWADLLSTARPFTLDQIQGPVLCLVPHADDETLGCGGFLAGCFEAHIQVDIVLVSDGTQSHPGAQTFGSDERRDIREAEFREALHILGSLPDTGIAFWRQPDTALALPEVQQFLRKHIGEALDQRPYAALLCPWRLDPHSDHRALTTAVLELLKAKPARRENMHRMEYCVWLGVQGSESDFPACEKTSVWMLSLPVDVRARKRSALAAHRSQIGGVFDDPDGFVLPEALLDKTTQAHEYFIVDYERS